jgi:hypothetical protein
MTGQNSGQTRKKSKVKVKVTHVTIARVTHGMTIHMYNDGVVSSHVNTWQVVGDMACQVGKVMWQSVHTSGLIIS